MFRQVSLLAKRPDLPTEAFEAYYENNHSPILAELMHGARRYLRRYVRPERNAFGRSAPVPFDCVTELWCASREEFAECASALADPEAYRRLYEDEENLFASHDNPLFSVDEVETVMPGVAEEAMFRLVLLVRRRDGLAPDAFRERYEIQHRPLEEQAYASAARYVRRYVQTEVNPVVGEPIEIDFDIMTEVWWNDRADWEAACAALAGSRLGNDLQASEAAPFSAPDYPVFSVVEFDSAMRGWRA